MQFKEIEMLRGEEIAYAFYATLVGPLGFLLGASFYNSFSDFHLSGSTAFDWFLALGSVYYIGLAPSIAIGLVVMIPFHLTLKMLRLDSPLIIAISGAPLMWLFTQISPEMVLRELLLAAAAAVSAAYGSLLFFSRLKGRKELA